jgi:hypothetical protein
MSAEDFIEKNYKCRVCGLKTKPLAPENANWEMQYLHLEEGSEPFKVLTCHICKLLPPSRFLEILKRESMN